jgi:ComF family protein
MKVLDYILDIFYPPKCMLCRKLLKGGEKGICVRCAGNLPKYRAEEGRRDIKNVRLCVFPFKYKDALRDSLIRYKFNGAVAYAQVYAEFIAKSIDENEISCDIISWVPIHRKRYRERGYDQSKLIAKALAKKLGVPCRKLLIKGVNNKRHSSIDDREERKRNVSGVYRLATKDALVGKRILLVDDIVTSGSTISECAAVLKGAGCTEIYAAAVASAAP